MTLHLATHVANDNGLTDAKIYPLGLCNLALKDVYLLLAWERFGRCYKSIKVLWPARTMSAVKTSSRLLKGNKYKRSHVIQHKRLPQNCVECPLKAQIRLDPTLVSLHPACHKCRATNDVPVKCQYFIISLFIRWPGPILSRSHPCFYHNGNIS